MLSDNFWKTLRDKDYKKYKLTSSMGRNLRIKMEFKLFQIGVKSLLLILLVVTVRVQSSTQPNIIYILADDLGWNDVR
jgi:hypothetical protein